MATSSEREERRKRILDKGLNRMSHITSARPRNISSSPLPPADHHHRDCHQQPPQSDLLHDEAKNESFYSEKWLSQTSHAGGRSKGNPPIVDSYHQAPQTYFSNQFSAGPGDSYEISRANLLDVESQAELKLRQLEDTVSALVVGQRKPSQKASSNGESLQKPWQNQLNLFSSKRLNSCILGSERTRSFCALLIAVLVLLSYIGYPLLGINLVRSESIIVSRPVYIILLTDLTVVIGRLYLHQKGEPEEAEEEMGGSQINKQNWNGAVKLLERGLVVYQTIRALFIDFSIYAVVVVCGLSLI